MSRAPFQVLIIPYRSVGHQRFLYGLFKRKAQTGGYWQWIAGGGEDDETPIAAARREAHEEAGISIGAEFIALNSRAQIPASYFSGHTWGRNVQFVPEYSFGVRVASEPIVLSHEHDEYRWSGFDEAIDLLHWESNRVALRELHAMFISGGNVRSTD